MSREDDKRAQHARARERYERAIAYVMADPRGRHFVWCVLGKTGMNANLMGNNAGHSSWMIGRRDVGIELQRDMRDDFDFLPEWRLMEDEALAIARREAQPDAPQKSESDEE